MKNYSKQREEIVEVMQELGGHPTAEEIYFLAKQKDPAISRSTVYRNLKALEAEEWITQIALSGGPDRYEYMVGRIKHGHAVCVGCGKLLEFSLSAKIKESISQQTGLEIWEDGIVVKGVCDSCKKLRKEGK